MHVHLVFVAKYRRLVFDGDAIDRLRGMFASTSNSNRRHTSQQRTPMASALSFPDQARRLCLNVATRQIAWTRFAAHYDHLDEVCRAFRSAVIHTIDVLAYLKEGVDVNGISSSLR
jgi:hypothetical protein